MVAGALTPPPRAALPVALAVSLAVHAAALEWWAPAVWWTSSPSTVSLPELRATLVEIAVVAPSPAMAETALPATPPSGVAPAPSNVVRLPTHPVVVPSPRVPSVAAAPPPAAVIAAAPHAPERPALPESPPSPDDPPERTCRR